MTVVNPKSISGINSITTGSGSDNLLTIHTSDANNTERLRIDSTGATKVGSGVTLSPDGNVFTTGISTFGGDVQTTAGNITVKQPAGTDAIIRINEATTTNALALKQTATEALIQTSASQPLNIRSQNGSGSTSYLAFWTRDDERLRIASNGRVGIGSTIPTTALDVNGVITGDGSGLTTINTPSFSAYVTGTPSITGNTNTTVVFDTEDHDTDGAYNNTNGIFTVPAGKAGKYHIDAYGGIDDINDETYVRVYVQKNGSNIPGFRAQSHVSVNNRVESTGVSGTVTLAVGDQIRVQLFTNDGTSGHEMESEACRFSMFRLAI